MLQEELLRIIEETPAAPAFHKLHKHGARTILLPCSRILIT